MAIEIVKKITLTLKTKYSNRDTAFENMSDEEIIARESDKETNDIIDDLEFCDSFEINSIEVEVKNDNQ